ncbi:MAG TPA: aldo/keto reductase [Ktedonobacteraceae bacterium]|jgi:aryl-alcohol dehydrogenase-like predicted oxidoreductase
MPDLGNTALHVTPFCLGGNVFGWTLDEHDSYQVLDAYLGEGGNFIDTADAYSAWVATHRGGESETIIGNWMHNRRNRSRVVLATKVGMLNEKGRRSDLSREHILRSADASLRRLRTDYIDLYFAHADDAETPLEETLDAFAQLVGAGKVRALGASNYSAPRMAEALRICEARGYPRYQVQQPLYNVLRRDLYEGELEAFCVEHGLGVVTYAALASGFLTGKYRQGVPLPQTQRAASVQQRYWNEQNFAFLAQLQQVAARCGATPAQVAVAWLLTRPGVSAPIASATTAGQLHELMAALRLNLDQQALAALADGPQGEAAV